MPRRKRYIIAVEDVQPDTSRSERFKYLHNFICYEDTAEVSFKKESLKNIWKEKKKVCDSDFEKIMKSWKDPKKILFFHEDMLNTGEAKLSPKVKLTDEYIYRVRDWGNISSTSDIYVTYREAVGVAMRILKGKTCIIYADGTAEKAKCSESVLERKIDEMSKDTNEITIAPIGKNGKDEEICSITIFKNNLR